MLFNSFSFLLFLPVVFSIYWLISGKNIKWQNGLLLISSYFFYSCWDWRFLFLLVFSTILDYYSGIKIAESEKLSLKKFYFWLSIVINLGFLGVLKYYNFFIESFADMFSIFGVQLNHSTLKFVLPVGISFYTFHGLSYVIDIYKKRIQPERNFIDYSLFVSYFPLLVAGPIERATHLLPQLKVKRIFNYDNAVDGLRQILWGLFKKVVIADNCAKIVNQIFDDYPHQSGSNLVLGAILFSFQIYGDFSGYSDIALGTSRLFGIELLRNFNFPYFSRDIAEFWRKWHISLSTWFRDYLYIPLGGSKGSKWIIIRNTLIIFLVSGFWHGANWTFIFWGLLNAVFILPSVLMKTNRKNLDIVGSGKSNPSSKELFSILFTFGLTTFAWIFFRSKSLSDAFRFVRGIFNKSLLSIPNLGIETFTLFVFITILIIAEWFQRNKKHGLEFNLINGNTFLRWSVYTFIAFSILFFNGSSQEFIYFQF